MDHTTNLRSAATAGTVTVSLAEQLEQHRMHADVAYDALIELMQMPGTRQRIINLAERRLAGPGFDEYGDAMFHQTFGELLDETDDELADGVNRMVAWMRRQRSLTQRLYVFRSIARPRTMRRFVDGGPVGRGPA